MIILFEGKKEIDKIKLLMKYKYYLNIINK